ncbi:hypothetical protein ACFVFJ_44260 [Streptomyces sp. NPDC057717]|uniref:hypothetical protein n=1 Tax=Streptomyces sp. NPDC057717 TaxID=3346224 RepID=UPI0036CBFB1A
MSIVHAPTEMFPVEVPAVGTMSENQQCGRACAWCDRVLLGRPAVDLGERDDAESGRRLFPRACPSCTRDHVYVQLVTHTARCGQCADNGAYCPDSAEVRRALREGRRL